MADVENDLPDEHPLSHVRIGVVAVPDGWSLLTCRGPNDRSKNQL